MLDKTGWWILNLCISLSLFCFVGEDEICTGQQNAIQNEGEKQVPELSEEVKSITDKKED